MEGRSMKVEAPCPDFLRTPLPKTSAHVHLLVAEGLVHAFAALHELTPGELTDLHETAFVAASRALADPDLSKSDIFTAITQAAADRLTGPELSVVPGGHP